MSVRETNALAASARRLRILRRLAPVICVLCVICGFGYSRAAEPSGALAGKLVSVPGGCPLLRVAKKDYTLTARTTYLYHTLQDQRLANREVRLEGVAKPDGTFEVSKLYTMRDGKLYRIRYYCEVCNIEALEPGNCVCCQQPTELQEIPVAETK